jgi:hypothetical protein
MAQAFDDGIHCRSRLVDIVNGQRMRRFSTRQWSVGLLPLLAAKIRGTGLDTDVTVVAVSQTKMAGFGRFWQVFGEFAGGGPVDGQGILHRGADEEE